MFFLFLQENIHYRYSLEAPWQGTYNEYHNTCFLEKQEKYQYFWIKKKIKHLN